MPTSRRRFLTGFLSALGGISAMSALGTLGAGERCARADTRGGPATYRAHFPPSDLFIPSHFRTRARGGASTYDVVIHQHGVLAWQEVAFARAHVNAALVSVNLGEGSGPYEKWFSSPRALDALVAQIESAMDKSGRAVGARVGRIALSGWSAGFGGVGALLAQPASVQRIDAVLLEDGLHTSYVAASLPDRNVLAKYAAFAQLAIQGDKLFAISHSAVRAPGYASTTETVSALLDMVGVAKVLVAPSVVSSPFRDGTGARAIYEAHRGAFHVQGFTGGGVDEHRDHARYMDATLLPWLEARWA
jgi:hypothetical protein